MNHQQATRHFPALLADELDGDRRAELTEHLEACDECREWSETYGFLSAALQADYVAEHPSSEQLAQLAIDAGLLTAPERERLTEHIEVCDECRRDLELSRQALSGARAPSTVVRFPARPSRAVALRLAVAAGLILALTLTFVAVRPHDERSGPFAAYPATGPGDTVHDLSGVGLTGTRLIEAPRVISASSVVIESGSDITLRAGEMVVLGDGFSVGSHASLGVEITPRPIDESDSHS